MPRRYETEAARVSDDVVTEQSVATNGGCTVIVHPPSSCVIVITHTHTHMHTGNCASNVDSADATVGGQVRVASDLIR